MKRTNLYFFVFSLTLLSISSQAQTLRSTLDKMYNAIGSIQTMSYDMTSQERINGKMVVKNMKFKIQISPRKVYMKDKDSGVELLYVSGWNSNQAYINPNGFPWMNVSFDINNSKVRADGHHPVTHAGFAYLSTLMRHTEKLILQAGMKVEDRIKIASDVTWNGRSCTRIVMEDPNFKFVTHTCTQSETLFEMCERLNFSEYMIMEKNKLGYGAKVSKGTTLQVPSAFAKKVELYIDKANNLPVAQFIYDQTGLFEKFEFKNLVLSPKLEAKEWTTQCASYGF
jgi:outer membrane lipoprotein-sorting protein